MNYPTLTILITSSILILGLTVSCSSNPNVETVVPSPQPAVNSNSNLTPSPPQNTPNSTPSDRISGVFYAENSIALKGFDVVAYFQQEQAIPGNPNFNYQWGNVNWQFSTAENRDLFVQNPEKYVPQYGGFCAWAVSQGYTAPIDPNAWKIVDGKLYLNANPRIQKRWAKDIPGNITKADKNWPGLAKEIQSK